MWYTNSLIPQENWRDPAKWNGDADEEGWSALVLFCSPHTWSPAR